MPDLKAAIVLSAIDKATAPLKGLSRSAGGTQAALARLGNQSASVAKLSGLQSSLGKLASRLDASKKRTAELGRQMKAAESPSKKLQSAFERSRRETIQLAGAHKRQRSELRNLSASLRRAGLDTRRLDAEQERLNRTSERLRRRLARLAKTGGSPRRGGGALMGHVGALGAYAGGGALLRGLRGFFGTASKFEDMESTLATIEGSGAKAEKSFEWIEKFTAGTPYQLDQVGEAFVKLRAYGIDPIGGALRTLGDTASGMSKSLDQAVEALADARVGEYERLKEFAIKARTSGGEVTFTLDGESRTVAKDSGDAIEGAVLSLMEGKFGGGMEAKMKLFSGLMSNLADKWTTFQNMVMEAGPFELVKNRLRRVLDALDAMHESGDLEAYAARIGHALKNAFLVFEQDVWPVLRDDIWPALKDIGGWIETIWKAANKAAEAFGGWGNVLKLLAAYKIFQLGAGLTRGVLGKGKAAWEFGGDVRDAWADRAVKGARGKLWKGAVDLGRGGVAAGKSGLGKLAGWLLRLGGFIVPLASVALKGLAVLAGAITGPIAAAAAAIAIAGVLIWKNWEPIKGFFAKLWEGVKKAFSAAWEWLSSIDWSGLGEKLLSTLAAGIRAAVGLPFKALEFALGKLRDLLPGSDARAGPLSRLTASGMAILPTMGEGVRRAGPGGLQRPLARALGTAAAGLALSGPAIEAARPGIPLAAAPAPAARNLAPVVHNHYRIDIRQLPGEDAQDLAERVLREIEARQALVGREATGDAY
ncbi:MAG: tape measure protein [Bryobacterales bacterium]|nr:tape measure protein [Bryobacterales bacterium]